MVQGRTWEADLGPSAHNLPPKAKKMIARHPCGTQSNSLPLLPSGPGGVRKSLLRRTRLSNRNISGGEGGIRTHGTLPHTRVPGVHLKPLGHLSRFFTDQTGTLANGASLYITCCLLQSTKYPRGRDGHITQNFSNYSRKIAQEKPAYPLGSTESLTWEVYSGITLPSSALIPLASWIAAKCLRFSSDSCRSSRQAPFPRNIIIFS